MDKLGIANLKIAVLSGVELANVIDGVSHAEGLAAKGQQVFRLADELMTLPQMDAKALLPEIKDLDDAEKAELHQAVKEKFDITDDKLEAVIEGGILLLIRLKQLIDEGLDLAKSLKAEPATA